MYIFDIQVYNSLSGSQHWVCLATLPHSKKRRHSSHLIFVYMNPASIADVKRLVVSVLGIKSLEELKVEATERKFPDNELLQRLTSVLSDAQKCQRTSAELLDGSQKVKMSLQELHTLVETMQNLPCVIEQLSDVQVSFRNVRLV